MANTEQNWVAQQSLPNVIESNPRLLHDKQHIVILNWTPSDDYILMKYNYTTDTLTKWLRFEPPIKEDAKHQYNHLICFVTIFEDKLFFFMEQGDVITFNISKNEWAILYLANNNTRNTWIGGPDSSCLITMNNEIHIVCGLMSHQLILKTNTNNKNNMGIQYDVFENNLSEFIDSDDGSDAMCCSRMIYLKKQNRFLLIGVYIKPGETRDKILACDLNENNDFKWNEIDIQFSNGGIADFGCVVTSNEKYILIFGGESGCKQFVDDIYIFNSEKMLIMKSKLKCPMKSDYYAILTNNCEKNEFLVRKYLTNCWKLKEFRKIRKLPLEIIDLIASFSLNEFVHLFTISTSTEMSYHWKIPLWKILKT